MPADKGATDAAAKKAKELNVDPEKVEGSGKEGTVTVSDVEEKAKEPDKLVFAKPADSATAAVVGPDGKTYPGPEPVSEDYFDAVLADCKDRDGKPVLKKVPVRDEEGGEA